MAPSKEVQVIQKMVKLVEGEAAIGSFLKGEFLIIALIKIVRKSAEEVGDREFGFPMAVVSGGVNETDPPLSIL
ncbi:MAG: hypothetical protein OXB88_02330 [Bacteriovoracales bacterium]|nr:hypothetical protein [Bacteriovoracales bacterium]